MQLTDIYVYVGNLAYYVGIMLNVFMNLLCLKLIDTYLVVIAIGIAVH